MTASKADTKKATDAAKPKAACPTSGSNAESCGVKKENAPAAQPSKVHENHSPAPKVVPAAKDAKARKP